MNDPTLNTWTSLFLLAAAQGYFLSIAIFSRRSKVNNLLGFLILVFSICLTYYVAFWTGYYREIPPYFAILTGTTYLLGPLVYFYIRSERNKIYFNPFHFIPFILFVVYFFVIPLQVRIAHRWISTLQVIIQNLHLSIYGILAFVSVNDKGQYHNGELKIHQWKNKVAICFNGYVFTFLLYYILVWTKTLKVEYDYMISMASAFFIYFTGYYGFVRPEIFRYFETGKYERSSLNHSAAEAVLKSIKNYFETEHPYLDNDLKMAMIAEKLGLAPHHISQAINELERMNFPDFVNKYRIEKAIEILSDRSNPDIKIFHVAIECGFNNKTSFNNAFKKITGQSPAGYRKSSADRYIHLQTP